MSFFPRPVYFTWLRAIGQPFAERIEPYGMVYHLDGREDAIRLFTEQQGLGWTSHPRIKASFATPDAFKDADFYKSRIWLGAAWKSMPVDLSQDRLGRRPLDLLDDMSNWAIAGGYSLKAMPGEIDLFEIDRTNELYANMNTNYLQLDRLPRGDDWTPVLDALRERKFFTTTGEIAIHSFAIHDGKATVDSSGHSRYLSLNSFPATARPFTGSTSISHRQWNSAGRPLPGRLRTAPQNGFAWRPSMSRATWLSRSQSIFARTKKFRVSQFDTRSV